MLGRHFRTLLDKHLMSFAKTVTVSPDTITFTGLAVTALAALVLSESLFFGGLLIIVGAFFDMFDGAVARVQNKATHFGAFLDSVIDRYSDAFLFMGAAGYFYKTGSGWGVFASIASMTGAMLVSYTRARAEGLGKECSVGLMERPERILLMSFGALTGLLLPVMWLMLVLTHLTVVQRIRHVWNVMNKS